MGSQVADREVAVAIDAANAALDSLAVAGMVASDARDAVTLVREVESLVRRARSLAVAVVDGIDRAGWHRADGHASAKVMVRHVARLSAAEAGRRMADAKALRDLPEVAAAYRAGRIGSDQVDRIGRMHANPRVSGKVGGQDRNLVQAALHLSYREFDLKVSEWERLVDEDGARDRNQAHHDKRDASMAQDWDGRWRFTGSCGSLAGTLMYEIHKAFYEAETLTDWEKARAEHGDAATVEHLPRTDAQRRFDAWAAIFEKAAAARAAEPGGSIVVANIVIDQATFEEEVRRFAGAAPSPDRPEPDIDPQPGTRLRCATVDGGHVDPTEAVAAALVGHVRRVVIGADGVVTDLGRRSRVFTGPAKLAVRLSSTECYWPGCHVPVSHCEADHLRPWSGPERGRTSPANGGPACGRHNRFKERGFTAWRDPGGTMHVLRPDGTELE
ncbi:MAG: DUF222 domain-containing protein [Actinobacteria bacterium]|nr:DUF222 domain-containing protein [Actinomycetota bacterium]